MGHNVYVPPRDRTFTRVEALVPKKLFNRNLQFEMPFAILSLNSDNTQPPMHQHQFEQGSIRPYYLSLDSPRHAYLQ